MLKRNHNQGYSIFEYVVLIILVLSALFIFRSYILKALNGKHKALGDAYGFGRQYDPKRTIACGYDDRINAWYDETCYENQRRLCASGNEECDLAKVSLCHVNASDDNAQSLCDEN